ncbi:hypothetical protein MIMGU_mgv1a011539mg [Erythranthe guttata]|uniref:Dof zinc finger protein n=2 Tax=Erythranthe guttata TaxID=4155 RepID=A0A022S1W5_ERYGU|nr:PREDICTED: dof zinc finger protein DOF4.6-like isoform X1 [Erythranthe guttata]EYU45250.1 hypothetical protein MIMGU_mgv1a011539mg [Erythranthe guttata]|eukprot:XP_012844640.1 PREDICTED: dof zinc finger protein DOF4.6-like isoform X1 [Erythranthe guttata]
MDTASAQWPQDIATCPKQSTVERKAQKEKVIINCPRCNSTNTKFCYYNNYSLSQPRYFCKTCRRYWTEGGSLRNIPVGGGSRKNKRSSSSSSSSSNSKIKVIPNQDLVIPPQNPNLNKIHDILENNINNQDLNLGFSMNDFKTINEMIRVPSFDIKELQLNPCSSSSSSFPSSVVTSNNSIITDPIITSTVNYNSPLGFSSLMMPAGQFKSSDLNFSIDGLGSNYGSFQGAEEQNGKVLFPFEVLKNRDSSNANDANRSDHHAATGYWNGVIGGGGSW